MLHRAHTPVVGRRHHCCSLTRSREAPSNGAGKEGGTVAPSREGGRPEAPPHRAGRVEAGVGWAGGQQPGTAAREADWRSGGRRRPADGSSPTGRHGSREGAEPPSKVTGTGARRRQGG
jgi:hypothetical protein